MGTLRHVLVPCIETGFLPPGSLELALPVRAPDVSLPFPLRLFLLFIPFLFFSSLSLNIYLYLFVPNWFEASHSFMHASPYNLWRVPPCMLGDLRSQYPLVIYYLPAAVRVHH